MQRFIEYKLQKYSKVYDSLNEDTILSKNRKEATLSCYKKT